MVMSSEVVLPLTWTDTIVKHMPEHTGRFL